MAYGCYFQVDALERDTLEVHRLIRSIKNMSAPVNRIPSEVLSLIPCYYYEYGMDRDLIRWTHVCRRWRGILISCPSLWTRINLTNIDKTRTYIQRSQSSPLKLYLGSHNTTIDVFPLIIPHIHRLKSLTINVLAFPSVLGHFRCYTPLLEELSIRTYASNRPVLDGALFNGDLSSLRELRLTRVTTRLQWQNLANLRVVNLESCFQGRGINRLLDFFESAPLLHTVDLGDQIRGPSDAPPERMVALRHLKVFNISGTPPHSILLDHLHIPVGASLSSQFCFRGEKSPFLDHLPERSPNLSNLSDITAVKLLIGEERKYIQLSGPSGSLRVLAAWKDHRASPSYPVDRRILLSLGQPTLSAIQTLAVFYYEHPRPTKSAKCSIFRTLSSTDNLRTLTLIRCNNLPFILALDPEQHPSGFVLCPGMEELVVYIYSWPSPPLKPLIDMAKNRASRGVRLSLIAILSPNDHSYGAVASKLRYHATRVEYRVDSVQEPSWGNISGWGGSGWTWETVRR